MIIGHISDIHWLDIEGSHFRDFLNKRISGGINLLAGRAKKHSKATLRCALDTLKTLNCDHLIVTGDLSNLALPGELRAVKKELNSVFRDEEMTIVPGNHDYYTRESLKNRRFEKLIYTSAPGNLDVGLSQTWPFVNIVQDVAIIGLNSAQPRPWFVAAGKLGNRQLHDLESVLHHPEVSSRTKIIALHHHLFQVVMTPGESLRNLEDRNELLRICQENGVAMIVHGHNHDFTQKRVGNLIVSEAGSCSVCTFKRDNRAGKFNLYRIDAGQIKKIETWRFENDQFKLWQSKDLSEIV